MRNKKQKHVFNTGEIPHLWAHRTQDDARNRQGNLYFEGDTIYSYGSHFPIARHVTNEAGERAVLFTTASYSVTTSGHCSAVRSAIPSGIPVFHVPEVYPAIHRTAKRIARREPGALCRDGQRSTSSSVLVLVCRSTRNGTTSKRKSYARRFWPTVSFSVCPGPTSRRIPALDSKLLENVRKLEAQRAAEKADQTRRERAEAIARQQELITKWRAGQYSGCLYDVPAMLRIDGDEVLTSRGVRFSISHAKRALAFVRRVRESGQAYVHNGHTIHLGAYAVDRIEPDGTVKAGCHVVSWQEIERIAPFLDSISTSAPAVNSTTEVSS